MKRAVDRRATIGSDGDHAADVATAVRSKIAGHRGIGFIAVDDLMGRDVLADWSERKVAIATGAARFPSPYSCAPSGTEDL